MAARGSHAAARFTPFDCFIRRPTERRFRTVKFKVGDSGGFLYLAGAHTRRANTDVFPHARHDRAHALQVRIPAAPPRVIRVADHVSKMRRFAAKLTLQCHFSSCFNFYLGLGFLLEYRKTKLLILADPHSRAKYAFSIPNGSPGTTCTIAGLSQIRQALFFRTGFERVLRTSNCSNRIDATGFASRKERRWPPVPLLTALLQLNLLLSVRRKRARLA